MSLQVQLIRTLDNGIETIGKMYVSGDATFASDSLERTYDGNKKGVSCIPGGKYICKKVGATIAIPYPHIAITGVSGRDGICMHTGNLYTHSKGCILLGKGFGDINKDGQKDILNSKNTFSNFMSMIPDEFTLTITEVTIKTKPQ